VLLWAAGVFAVRLASSIVMGWNTADEAWNLQVVARVLRGEVLYRDVYFGVLPLTAYVQAAACWIFGTEALVIKGLFAACSAGKFVLTHWLLRRAGREVKPWGLAVLYALVPLSIYTGNLYNELAPLTVLLLAGAVLGWQQKPSAWRALGMGVVLGLCVGVKQNVGCYAAAALAVVVMMSPAGTLRRRVGHLLLAGTAAATVVGAIVLPVALAGGWEDLVLLCFTNKTNYLRHAGVSFWDGFRVLGECLGRWPEAGPLAMAFWSLIFPLMLLTPVVMVVGMVRRPARAGWTCVPFLLAIAGNVYPRADMSHVMQAFPAMVVGLALTGPGLPRGWRRVGSAAGLGVAAVAIVVVMMQMPLRLGSRAYAFSTLPHARGLLLRVEERDRLERTVRALKGEAGPVFILSGEAGALYLLSGVENPTRYDYPLVNAFPAGEQERLIGDIDAGRIRTVAVHESFPPVLVPRELAEHLCTKYAPAGRADGYVFYRMGAAVPVD
jgi:hypothetical protein